MSQTKLQNLCEVSVVVTNQIPASFKYSRVSSSDLFLSWQNLMYFWACRSNIWWQNLQVLNQQTHTLTLKDVYWLHQTCLHHWQTDWQDNETTKAHTSMPGGRPASGPHPCGPCVLRYAWNWISAKGNDWINNVGRIACTIIASMNFKSKNISSNNRIICSSWPTHKT